MPVGNIHQTYTDLSSQSCQQSGGSMGSLCWPLYNSTFAVILVISLFFFYLLCSPVIHSSFPAASAAPPADAAAPPADGI